MASEGKTPRPKRMELLMGIPTPRDKAAQEEHRKFRPKFFKYVKDMLLTTPATRKLIELMAQNLSTFTLETIRQRLEDGKIDISTLPMAGAEPWKVEILKAVAVLDEPERDYQKRIDEAISIMNDVVTGGSA